MTSPFWFREVEYFIAKPTPVLSEAEVLGQKMEPNTLVIQDLGIKAPIIAVTERTETAFQEALANGIGHYPGSAPVGQYGNTYLFGHSSDYLWKDGSYKNVFALLTHIAIGQKILASDSDGNLFTYTVTDTKIVGPNDTSVLDQFNNERRMLSLQTSYPIGTALKRFVVIAEITP